MSDSIVTYPIMEHKYVLSAAATEQDYMNHDPAYVLGQRAGYVGEAEAPYLEAITAAHESHLSDQLQALETELSNARTELENAERKAEETETRLQPVTEALEKRIGDKPPYSIVAALLYFPLGLLFWFSEIFILLRTITNVMGMDSELRVINLADPYSYEGLLVAIALGAIPLILKIWLERYIISPVYEKNEAADRLFKYLLLPVGAVTLLLTVSSAMLRWVVQPLIMEPLGNLEIWKLLFTLDGRFAWLGGLFIGSLVLSLLVCSSLSMAIGLYHFKGLKVLLQRKLQIARLRKIKDRMTRQLDTLKDQLSAYRERIRSHDRLVGQVREKIEKACQTVVKGFLAGFASGRSSRAQYEKAQKDARDAAAEQEKRDTPLYVQVRRAIAEAQLN